MLSLELVTAALNFRESKRCDMQGDSVYKLDLAIGIR